MNKSKTGIIYMILNLETDKCYIGSSISVKNRFRQHLYDLKNNNHHSPHFQYSFNKYGKDNFKFVILEKKVPFNILYEREKYWILYKQSHLPEFGYNVSVPNINGSPSFSDKSIDKIRRIVIERVYGKMPNWKYQEHIHKKDRENAAKELSNEWKEIFQFDHVPANAIQLHVIDNDSNEILHSFFTINECCDALNINVDTVRNRLNSDVVLYPLKRKYHFVKMSNYDKNKDYRYKCKVYEKKGRESQHIFTGYPLVVIDSDCNILEKYDNISDMSEKTGISEKSLRKIMSKEPKKRKSGHHYIRKYKKGCELIYEYQYDALKLYVDTGKITKAQRPLKSKYLKKISLMSEHKILES